MSRYRPIALRRKHQTPSSQSTSRTIARLALRISAMVCWFAAVALLVLAVRNIVDNGRAGAGALHPEPFEFVLGAIAAILLGWRVWALKRWANITAASLLGLFCLLDPWRREQYPNAVIEVPWAVATSLVCLVLFTAPLVAAIYVEWKDLRTAF